MSVLDVGVDGVVAAEVEPVFLGSPRKILHVALAGGGLHDAVFADEIVQANKERMKERGVIFTDHEPSHNEKLELEAEAEKRNLAFRLAAIQEYGKQQWIEGFNRAANIAGVDTTPQVHSKNVPF